MQFISSLQCDEWLAQRGGVRPNLENDLHTERFRYPAEAYRFFAVASAVAHCITYAGETLLWVTEWGIWPSSENWQLYNRLRNSYGDRRSLKDAPGHLFQGDDTSDLVSFLQLSLLNGWGGYIQPDANRASVFFSHDEYFEFFFKSPENIAGLRDCFGISLSTGGVILTAPPTC